MTRPIYIVDIDGTIADLGHRLHHIRNKPKNWPAFEKGCVDDVPILPTITMVHALAASGAKIIYCSGRSEKSRQRTIDWFEKHNIIWDGLYMRPEGVYDRDDIVKHKLHEQIWAEHGKPVLYIDDRNQVVDMIRARGDTCHQVQPGDF